MFANIRRDLRNQGGSLLNRGFWALLTYRYGAWILGLRRSPLRWVLSKTYGLLRVFNEMITKTTIYGETRLGADFRIACADGPVAIHPAAIVGDRCQIMHNTTIGANMQAEVPTIGDDVLIGIGAVIIGGVKIGDRASIAARTLVITDVPPDSIAIGVPATIYPILSPRRPRPTLSV